MGDGDAAALRAQAASVNSQICECQDSMAGLDEKIARLKRAKGMVAPIDDQVIQLRYGIERESDVDEWKGKQRDDYDRFVDDMVSADMKTYSDGASDLFAHIADEVTRLENERNEGQGAFGWLKQQLNNIQNELDKLVN